MLSKSLYEMVKCRWREFAREPSACFFVIFMPILAMLILGSSFSGPVEESYRVSLVKQKQNNTSTSFERLKKTLQQHPEITLSLEPMDVAQKKLKKKTLRPCSRAKISITCLSF